jgi:hypothetical protein
MPIRAEQDISGKFLRVTMAATWPQPVEQAEMRARLMQCGDTRVPVLIDMRAVVSGLSPVAMRDAVATAVAQQLEPPKRAMLVATPVQERAAEHIRHLAAFHGAEIRVFWEEAAAVDWLTKPQARASRAAAELRATATVAFAVSDPAPRPPKPRPHCPQCAFARVETIVQGTTVTYACPSCTHSWAEALHDVQPKITTGVSPAPGIAGGPTPRV